MEFILEIVFELLFEGIIEGSQNKKVPKPIRYLCSFFIIIFLITIIGGIGYLAINIFLKGDHITSVILLILDMILVVFCLAKVKNNKSVE